MMEKEREEMRGRTKVALALVLISVAYAAISKMGPEIGPFPNPLKQVKCLKMEGRPSVLASGPLIVLATGSPLSKVYALGENGSIAWKLEIPGRVTSASWWNDRVALGTNLGALIVIGRDGSVLGKMKFDEGVQLLSWNEDGRLALVTEKVTPDGEELSKIQLPIKLELGGKATYLGWMDHRVVVSVKRGKAVWLMIAGNDGAVKREINADVLDSSKKVAISTGEKTLLLDEGSREEIQVEASVGCWHQDKLYLGGRSGLYLYNGSLRLRRLLNGSVVNLSCGEGVAAAFRWNGSWFIYVDGETLRVEGQPSNLIRSPDGRMLAFSLKYGGKTGIVREDGGLETVRGQLLGWAGRRVAVYRDGEVCVVQP